MPAGLGRLLDAYLPRQRRFVTQRLLSRKQAVKVAAARTQEDPESAQVHELFMTRPERHGAEFYRLEAMTDDELVARGVNGPVSTTPYGT